MTPRSTAASSNCCINPAPFLLALTICVNLAATLTPFGSAQSILIANEFALPVAWFVTSLGLYFAVSLVLTLLLLDLTFRKRNVHEQWECAACADEGDLIPEVGVAPAVFRKNLIALGVFVALLVLSPSIVAAGIVGTLLFVALNPITVEGAGEGKGAGKGEIGGKAGGGSGGAGLIEGMGGDAGAGEGTGEAKGEAKGADKSAGRQKVDFAYYLKRVDLKLVFFFACLFLLVFLMKINGTIRLLEDWVETLSFDDTFLLSVVILLLTSLLSGLLDNTPVTIMFIPVIRILTGLHPAAATPVLVAFIIGINVGGNFLPQGSAADLATLEISEQYKVRGMSFRVLTKYGAAFAALHVAWGIGYLALLQFVLL